MSTLVRHAPDGREIDVACATSADLDLIASLHGHPEYCRLTLECLSTSGDRTMFVKKINGKYFFSHFANGGHGSHEVIPESDAHKRAKHYTAAACEAAGYETGTEVPTGRGTRLDVAVKGGDVLTGFEIQRSQIPAPQVKSRTTRSHRAGYLPVWFNDWGPRPNWLYDVPAFGGNGAAWHEYMPQPGSVTATGLVVVEARPCGPEHFARCPEGSPRPCGRFHPKREPWRGLTVDDVAAKIPAGEIVPLQARAVYLVSPANLARYMELTDGHGEWIPGGKPKKSDPQQERPSAPCRNPHTEPDSPLGPWVRCAECRRPYRPMNPSQRCYDCRNHLMRSEA